jgi:hypothetical protein
MIEMRRMGELVCVAVIGLAACSSAGGRGDGIATLDDSFTGGTVSASATDGVSASSMTSPSTDTSDTDDGGGLKLDVGGGTFDLGGGAVPPSCDNIDEFPNTSVGCEFYAVQVPSNHSPLPYGISVGNPGDQPAHVSIEDMRGPGGTLRTITAVDVPPHGSVLTEINGQGGILAGESHMIAPGGLNERAAFRVTSNVPVTAMQIFPVGGGPSHISEASLLLPVNSLDTSYIAVGYPQYAGGDSFIVVVAIEDATTVQTTQGDVMLDQFDAWNYHNGSDATGFFLSADKPVAVFSGADCVMVPGLPWYACDHIEEQVIPLAAWGTEYVGARHPHRVPAINPSPETVYWRVIAAGNATTVTLQPPVAGVGGVIQLASLGDFYEFETAESFVATSNDPFMLVQYMSGCYNVITQTASPMSCAQGATGDPYMMQMVPVEQWLTSLPFVTDTSYPRDFVIIAREAGTQVTLDCLGLVDDAHFSPIPGTTYEVGFVDLDIEGQNGGEGNCVDGEQYLTATAPVGVLVGGVDWATSYGYPGGLSLGELWVPPHMPPG